MLKKLLNLESKKKIIESDLQQNINLTKDFYGFNDRQFLLLFQYQKCLLVKAKRIERQIIFQQQKQQKLQEILKRVNRAKFFEEKEEILTKHIHRTYDKRKNISKMFVEPTKKTQS